MDERPPEGISPYVQALCDQYEEKTKPENEDYRFSLGYTYRELLLETLEKFLGDVSSTTETPFKTLFSQIERGNKYIAFDLFVHSVELALSRMDTQSSLEILGLDRAQFFEEEAEQIIKHDAYPYEYQNVSFTDAEVTTIKDAIRPIYTDEIPLTSISGGTLEEIGQIAREKVYTSDTFEKYKLKELGQELLMAAASALNNAPKRIISRGLIAEYRDHLSIEENREPFRIRVDYSLDVEDTRLLMLGLSPLETMLEADPKLGKIHLQELRHRLSESLTDEEIRKYHIPKQIEKFAFRSPKDIAKAVTDVENFVWPPRQEDLDEQITQSVFLDEFEQPVTNAPFYIRYLRGMVELLGNKGKLHINMLEYEVVGDEYLTQLVGDLQAAIEEIEQEVKTARGDHSKNGPSYESFSEGRLALIGYIKSLPFIAGIIRYLNLYIEKTGLDTIHTETFYAFVVEQELSQQGVFFRYVRQHPAGEEAAKQSLVNLLVFLDTTEAKPYGDIPGSGSTNQRLTPSSQITLINNYLIDSIRATNARRWYASAKDKVVTELQEYQDRVRDIFISINAFLESDEQVPTLSGLAALRDIGLTGDGTSEQFQLLDYGINFSINELIELSEIEDKREYVIRLLRLYKSKLARMQPDEIKARVDLLRANTLAGLINAIGSGETEWDKAKTAILEFSEEDALNASPPPGKGMN